ncbi:MAG TPA: glycosyltransferase [Acidimicrobiales bacterium]|nr:glycosyltransferase [Acidimicrobiales bacterium]
MRVLAACSLGGLGHLRPLLEVADALRGAGHVVGVVAPGRLAEVARARGYETLEGAEPPGDLLEALRARVAGPDPRDAALAGNRDLFAGAAARALEPALEESVARWRPELVVRETCEYAAAALARRRGLPVVQVAIGLARVEWASVRLAAPALEELAPGLADACRATPYLSGLPESIDPSPFARTHRYRRLAPAADELLPDWWPGDGRPLCYVTVGSVAPRLAGAAAMWEALVAGLDAMGCRVLATTGDADLAVRATRSVHVEPFVEQDRVLAEADVVVCHGGAGTVAGALAHGVPLVVAPILADNAANGRLVASHGAGIALERPRGPIGAGDLPAIGGAVARVLGDPGYRAAARDLARTFGATPSIAAALEAALAPAAPGASRPDGAPGGPL